MKTEYGTVNHNGMILTLQQHAFAYDDYYYRAHAKNANDEDYIIAWPIVNFETENEDETCDWDVFCVTKI